MGFHMKTHIQISRSMVWEQRRKMGQVQGLKCHLHQGRPQKYKTQRHFSLMCVCVFCFYICFGFVFCVCFSPCIASICSLLCVIPPLVLLLVPCLALLLFQDCSSPCVVVCSSPCITIILGSFLTFHCYCSLQLLLFAFTIIV